MTDLLHFERHSTEGEEIHWMWVLGSAGAVSTWFSNRTKEIIGYSVCDGAAMHHPRPVEGCEPAPCEFLESTCWCERGSMLFLEPIIEAYDTGALDIVWAWLEATYKDLNYP